VAELALRIVRALWHVVGILLITVLLAEFGVDWLRRGVRRLHRGRGFRPDRSAAADAYGGAAWPVAYFDEFNAAVRVDYRPYIGWWLRPWRGGFVTIDERGLRVTPGEAEAGPDAVRIWCFGGSTMMGMGARDAGTIPAFLAQLLRQRGQPVSITNLGQLGHNSTQAAIALHQLLKTGDRPDIAVFYDGINEMMCAEQTGRPDRVFHEAARRAEFNLLHPDRRGELLAAAVLAAMPRTVRRLRRLTGLPLRGPRPDAMVDLAGIDIAALAEQVVTAYAVNLRLVRLVAKAYGFRPLFFWQPVLATKRHKTADERRWASDHSADPDARQRLQRAIIAVRRHHPELAEAEDAIDLSGLFDDRAEPLYIDLYHLSETGNAAVAAAMLPALVDAVAAVRTNGRR
jgi:lysophospholipase L1-like esterase